MIKKYLILIIGLFFVTTSIIFAKPVDDFTYSDGTVVRSGDIQGCSSKMPSDAVPRDFNQCIKTIVSDPDRKVYIKDKDGKEFRYIYQKKGSFYLVYQKKDNGIEEPIATTDEKGALKNWIFLKEKTTEEVPNPRIKFREISKTSIEKKREEILINSIKIDSDKDGIVNIADKDLHPDAEDKDKDGVINQYDIDDNDKNKKQKDSITSGPSNQPGEGDGDLTEWEKICYINKHYLSCDTEFSTCRGKKKCRENYLEAYKNPLKGRCPKPMLKQKIEETYNCSQEDTDNAIKQAQENKTELVTQVMNLKEYCESKKSDRGKGLVQYDGVCDEYWGEKGGATTALFEMMDRILVWIRNIIIVIGSALLFWGGVLYIKSAADPNEKKKAKDLMMRVVIGLIFVLFAFAIVQLILDTFADGGVKGDYSGLSTEVKNK